MNSERAPGDIVADLPGGVNLRTRKRMEPDRLRRSASGEHPEIEQDPGACGRSREWNESCRPAPEFLPSRT